MWHAIRRDRRPLPPHPTEGCRASTGVPRSLSAICGRELVDDQRAERSYSVHMANAARALEEALAFTTDE